MAKPYLKRKPIPLELKLGITETTTRAEFKEIRKRNLLRIANCLKITDLCKDPLLNTIILKDNKVAEVTGFYGDSLKNNIEIICRNNEYYLLDFISKVMIKIQGTKILKLPNNEYIMANDENYALSMVYHGYEEEYCHNMRVLNYEYKTDDNYGHPIYEEDLLFGLTSEDVDILGLLFDHSPKEFQNEFDEMFISSTAVFTTSLYEEVKKLKEEK